MHSRYFVIIAISIELLIHCGESLAIIIYTIITYTIFFDFVYGNRLGAYDIIFLGLLYDYCNQSILGISALTNFNMWLIIKNYKRIFLTQNFFGLYITFIISIVQQIAILILISNLIGYNCSYSYITHYFLTTLISYPLVYTLLHPQPSQIDERS